MLHRMLNRKDSTVLRGIPVLDVDERVFLLEPPPPGSTDCDDEDDEIDLPTEEEVEEPLDDSLGNRLGRARHGGLMTWKEIAQVLGGPDGGKCCAQTIINEHNKALAKLREALRDDVLDG